LLACEVAQLGMVIAPRRRAWLASRTRRCSASLPPSGWIANLVVDPQAQVAHDERVDSVVGVHTVDAALVAHAHRPVEQGAHPNG